MRKYEILANYKILTISLNNLQIKKIVDVKKLSLCKYQDNLEFCLWIKNFCEHICKKSNQDN